MKILSVFDKEFARYGHVITGYDLSELLETLDRISPLPEGYLDDLSLSESHRNRR